MNRLINNMLKGAATVSIRPPRVHDEELNLYHPHASDTEAIKSDWVKVGVSLRSAMEKVDNDEES